MEKKTFEVPNIGCDGCIRTIKNELNEVIGVTRVEGDVATRIVTVEWDNPATWPQIVTALTEVEYPPAEA